MKKNKVTIKGNHLRARGEDICCLKIVNKKLYKPSHIICDLLGTREIFLIDNKRKIRKPTKLNKYIKAEVIEKS